MLSAIKGWFVGLSTLAKIGVIGGTVIVGSAVAGTDPNTSQPPPAEPPKVEAAKVEHKTETKTEPISYASSTIEDANLALGKTEVRTKGVNGVKTLTFDVTYEDGVEKSRQLINEVVTTPPINEVIAKGTYVAPPPRPVQPANCHPSYSGACLNPNASDYDCSGGSGNGPYYTGFVSVVGPDVFDLDRDGDGYGCE